VVTTRGSGIALQQMQSHGEPDERKTGVYGYPYQSDRVRAYRIEIRTETIEPVEEEQDSQE
jgi:hypothetical protein